MQGPICVIGDSVSGGVVFSEEKGRHVKISDSYINLLGRELGAEIDNRSLFGCTVDAALERMERYSGAIAASEYTLVALGGNDSDFDWPAVAAEPDFLHDCKTPMARFTEDYEAIVARVRALGSRPVLLGMIPVDGPSYFNWFSKDLDADALMRFLHTTASIEHWNEMYNIAVMKLAIKLNAPFIDLRSAFLGARYFKGLHSIDGIHPSAAGHRLLFEYTLPQAKSILL